MAGLKIGQSCSEWAMQTSIYTYCIYLVNAYCKWMVFDCLPLFCLDGGVTPLENVALLTKLIHVIISQGS